MLVFKVAEELDGGVCKVVEFETLLDTLVHT